LFLAICILGFEIYLQQSNKKKCLGKEMEFGGAQVIDIILQHWFPINLTFQLSKSEYKDEKEDNFSIELDLDVKSKGSTTSS
jgi:hypothetical protein